MFLSTALQFVFGTIIFFRSWKPLISMFFTMSNRGTLHELNTKVQNTLFISFKGFYSCAIYIVGYNTKSEIRAMLSGFSR